MVALYEGLFIGPSAGAALKASEVIAREFAPHRISSNSSHNISIVAILPDSGDRYFSSRLWEDKRFTELLSKIRWQKEIKKK
jgi:cysteine synthase B